MRWGFRANSIPTPGMEGIVVKVRCGTRPGVEGVPVLQLGDDGERSAAYAFFMILRNPFDSQTWRFLFRRTSVNSSQLMISMRPFRPFVNWIAPSVPFTRPGLSPALRAFSFAASTLIGSITM